MERLPGAARGGLLGLAVFPDRHSLGLQYENDTEDISAGWIL